MFFPPSHGTDEPLDAGRHCTREDYSIVRDADPEAIDWLGRDAAENDLAGNRFDDRGGLSPLVTSVIFREGPGNAAIPLLDVRVRTDDFEDVADHPPC